MREHDVGEVGKYEMTKIVNFLDRNPYLYRNIQACIYVEDNPIEISEDLIGNYKLIVERFMNYCTNILKIFFIFDDKKLTILTDTYEISDNFHDLIHFPFSSGLRIIDLNLDENYDIMNTIINILKINLYNFSVYYNCRIGIEITEREIYLNIDEINTKMNEYLLPKKEKMEI